jgi:uncharacterized SAM-binding protein YcdF (DUF218 family)
MQIYLHKILPVFLLPMGITLLLVLVGLFLRHRPLIWLGVVVLWLSSTPIVSHFAVRSAEGWAERAQAIDAPRADAIVVLSGGRVVAPGVAAVSEWEDADRFYGGVELFKAGKAPRLVFTGGWLPWEPKANPEGEILTEYAKALGVPAKDIVTTGVVVNTAEEAQAVAALLHRQAIGTAQGAPPRILLVTSAFHMPRAQRLFERAGLKVVPFPVDFKVSAGSELGSMDFLPSAGAMAQTEMAWREMYGHLYYWVRSVL